MRCFLRVFLVISAIGWIAFSSRSAAAQPSGFRFGVHGASRPGISRSQDGASMRTLYSTGLGSGGRSGFYQGSSVHQKVMSSLDRFAVRLAAKSAEALSQGSNPKRSSAAPAVKPAIRRAAKPAPKSPSSRLGSTGGKKLTYLSNNRVASKVGASNSKSRSPSWVQAVASKKSRGSSFYSLHRELRIAKKSVGSDSPWWSNKKENPPAGKVRKVSRSRKSHIMRQRIER